MILSLDRERLLSKRDIYVGVFGIRFCEEAPLDPWVTSEEDEIVRSDSPGKH